MTCPKCARRLVEIEVKLGDTDLTMRSCSRCDLRWWHRDGVPVELPSVLKLAAARR